MSATECVQGESVGVCSETFCAFPDPTCGFRYGMASGSLSGTCVESDVDAGIEASRPPIASFSTGSPLCDHTTLELDSSASQAFNGATITNYAWSIRDPEGMMVGSFEGGPGTGAHVLPAIVLGGSYANPMITFTPYQDNSAAKVGLSGGTTPLAQPFSFDGEVPESVQFFMSASVEVANTEITEVTVMVRAEPQTGNEETKTVFVDPDVGMQLLNVVLDIDTGSTTSDFVLIVAVPPGIEMWIDNVGLRSDNPSSFLEAVTPLTVNRDFEVGFDPWILGAGPDSVTLALLNGDTANFGEYSIALTVTDSSGLSSSVETVLVDHAPCDEIGGSSR